MKAMLVVGATSAIATAAIRTLAPEGPGFVLLGRDRARLETLAADLRVRGARAAHVLEIDARDLARHAAILDEAFALEPEIDAALVAHGSLVDQERAEADPAAALEAITVNFTSVVSILGRIAPRFEQAGRGTIAVLGSVAGDRGRRKNYVYGSAKGGLDVYLSGLRNRLAGTGVRVVTVKPGFVETPMTAHMPKNALFASAEAVGAGVVRAMKGTRDVVYLPWWWRPIMGVIRAIPEPLFKRLNI